MHWMRLFISGRINLSLCFCPRLITRTATLIFVLDITKTKFKDCLIIHCFELTANTLLHGTKFELALGNHTTCAQPTDKLVLSASREVTNL